MEEVEEVQGKTIELIGGPLGGTSIYVEGLAPNTLYARVTTTFPSRKWAVTVKAVNVELTDESLGKFVDVEYALTPDGAAYLFVDKSEEYEPPAA